MIPQVEIKFRPEAAAQFGLTPGDVRQAANTMLKGTKVGEIYQEQMIFDCVVWRTPKVRQDVTALKELVIDTPTGGHVPLGQVADVYVAPTPNGSSRKIVFLL